MRSQFVSYAQNHEDIILWRALKNIKNGFYIDVGAQDPCVDSVTLAFYQRGWTGINIDASAAYYTKLCEARPEDTNIHTFIGDSHGATTFYEIPETGLSTGDQNIAKQYRSEGLTIIEHVMPVITLNDVLNNQHHDDIHFLKVDVGGGEGAVFRGIDLNRHRPWIIIASATEPQSHTPSYEAFETVLIDASYSMCYFDGLNRFYVAAEKEEELKSDIALPPNIFDDYISAKEMILHKKVQQQIALEDDNYYKHDEVANEVMARLNLQLGELSSFFKERGKKIKSIRTAKHHSAAKKQLVEALRKHFGKSNLKLSDKEPTLSPLKRLLKSWLRPQGSINKSIFAYFKHNLEWQREMENKMTVIERMQKTLAMKLLEIRSDVNYNTIATSIVSNNGINLAEEEALIFKRLI